MRHLKLLLILAFIVAAIAIPLSLFLIRPPVLIVTDAPFAALYGASHLKRQRVSASLALFRQVKPVMIADGAGPDVVVLAITNASKQPYCVLCARSQAPAATRFHEQFPEIPVALLGGLIPAAELPSSDGVFCVYRTDRETDLYRAGLLAGILGGVQQKTLKNPERRVKRSEKNDGKNEKKEESTPVQQKTAQKTYVLWQDRSVQAAGRELFSRGIGEESPESAIIFANSANDVPDMKGISCAVLTGAGAEYLDKNPPMPLILFSWLNPALAAQELVVLFDDSVWALAVPAVRMTLSRQAEGKIPSKPLIFSGKMVDNSVFRILRKSAKKVP